MNLNNVDSYLLKVAYRVPQGLRPQLFIMYINDVCDVSKILHCVLFADDTSPKKWFDINKLSLNLSKTKFIIFGNCKINKMVKLKFESVDIECVYENKFLGITVDNKLSWKPHISNIKMKIYSRQLQYCIK